MELEPPFRRAGPGDAEALVELVNYAGEGLPEYLWGKLAAPGESARDVGLKRAARSDGSFSWTNAFMSTSREGAVAGCLIGYGIGDEPEPIGCDMPAMFRPLQELENLAPDTWYVNVLAVRPTFRGQGHGARLLGLAERVGGADGRRGMSVIVSDGNAGARRLYERCGYREIARRPMVKEDWVNAGENWVLMVKR